MAAGTGNLPNPGMSFSPFAILTAEEQNNLVENIESLATGAGLGDKAVTAEKIDSATLLGYNFRVFSNSSWNPVAAENRDAMPLGATVDYADPGVTLSSTGIFTAPVDGYYNFSGAVQRTGNVSTAVGFGKNGSSYVWCSDSTNATVTRLPASVSNVKLNAGDTFHLRVSAAPSPNIQAGGSNTWFAGYLVRAL